ncbi:transposase [uncultured Arenimonas sp.]|uniref:REP-associated tyrosine transposase n=1 Tax=uncultured Arenimonas sp. TaxID=546226 RepID=UPI0030DC84F1
MPYVLDSPGQKSLRVGRRSLSGQGYFLTFTTHGRERIFADWASASVMSRLVSKPENWPGSRLLAWVLMPDHWHGLLVLEPQGNLAKAIGHAKGVTAATFNRDAGRSGALWARGFYDRAVRSEAGLRKAARYLVANPLRAGLVGRIGDYPYWDAAWLTDDNPL